jgi:response regulator of citrate/malate metabolism
MIDRQSILIVEDESAVALMLARFAEKLGYEIVGQAVTAEEAITSALESKPDIILMDIKLAGSTNGITLAKYLQSVISFRLIYITGIIDREVFNSAVEETTFTDFLLKPVSIFRLRESLMKVRPLMKTSALH